MYIRACTCMYARASMYYVNLCVTEYSVHMHACVYVCTICVYMCIAMCIYLCVHVCACV